MILHMEFLMNNST
uniref:Uncharacterized protein n=1 Tax=Arundo donax TaxID=35708 RepID=A0A0A8ZPM4_ARUDO